MAKSWKEKLLQEKKAVVKNIDFAFSDIPENSVMLISTPADIAEYVSSIPKGKAVSVKQLRHELARRNKAEYTCPVTTGIFLRIVAEAAWEEYQQRGSLRGITPFWRVIEPGSSLAKKLSFGTAFISDQRRKEKIDE